MKIVETKEVKDYLTSCGILKAYKKAKIYILNDDLQQVRLKKRKPYSYNVWYFRITKKYRAFAQMKEDTLYVFHISDHQ